MKDHTFVALVAIALMCASYCTGCAAAKPTCEPKTVDAIGSQYAALAREVIAAGACDKHPAIETCPAYLLLEEHQDLTLQALGCR